MPPRKEPKENVVYPASKRKAPPFKPLKPSKLARNVSTESEKAAVPKVAARHDVKKAPTKKVPAATKTVPAPTARKSHSIMLQDSDDDLDNDLGSLVESSPGEDELEGSDDTSTSNPSTAQPANSHAQTRGESAIAATAKSTGRTRAPMYLSDGDDESESGVASSRPSLTKPLPPEEPLQVVPQALLVRLLHEAFEDKATRIDKHAIQVLQKYIEIFVRETMERAKLGKEEACERGEIGDMDKNWLDLEDLEKVAPAMLLDF
jgi:hypothetical protein